MLIGPIEVTADTLRTIDFGPTPVEVSVDVPDTDLSGVLDEGYRIIAQPVGAEVLPPGVEVGAKGVARLSLAPGLYDIWIDRIVGLPGPALSSPRFRAARGLEVTDEAAVVSIDFELHSHDFTISGAPDDLGQLLVRQERLSGTFVPAAGGAVVIADGEYDLLWQGFCEPSNERCGTFLIHSGVLIEGEAPVAVDVGARSATVRIVSPDGDPLRGDVYFERRPRIGQVNWLALELDANGRVEAMLPSGPLRITFAPDFALGLSPVSLGIIDFNDQADVESVIGSRVVTGTLVRADGSPFKFSGAVPDIRPRVDILQSSLDSSGPGELDPDGRFTVVADPSNPLELRYRPSFACESAPFAATGACVEHRLFECTP